ncbi:MAG: amino acid permease [Cyclobacteriaceae bacterium]|nr:amino acid permease [Cyclobacteriaceae bacterium]
MKVDSSEFLSPKLGLFSISNIVIANMVGAGIFTTSGLLMADLKSPWLLISLWVVGGVIALAGALCYGELGAAMPRAGGEYTFLSALYSPLLGFLSGWVSFVVGFSAPIAASAIGFSEYLYRAFPDAFQVDGLGVNWIKKICSISIILVFTGIHLRGMEFGARVQNGLTILKIALIIVIISFGFAFGTGSWDHFNAVVTDAPAPGWKTIGLSLMWIMFAFSGWNASVYIGSEIRNPRKNIPRSLLIGTVTVTLMYLFLNALFVYAVEPHAMSGVISIGGLAVKNLFGIEYETFFSLFISFALFSSISAFIILGPRVYYAMAADGKFFSFASKIHPRFGVPAYSIIFQAIISIAIILSGTFDQILTYMGFSLGIFPIITVYGLFKLRKEKRSTIRMPGYPFTPIIFIMAGIGMLLLSFLERPTESIIAIFTVLAGLPAYYLFVRKKSVS